MQAAACKGSVIFFAAFVFAGNKEIAPCFSPLFAACYHVYES
jgi:hypothetical protein